MTDTYTASTRSRDVSKFLGRIDMTIIDGKKAICTYAARSYGYVCSITFIDGCRTIRGIGVTKKDARADAMANRCSNLVSLKSLGVK